MKSPAAGRRLILIALIVVVLVGGAGAAVWWYRHRVTAPNFALQPVSRGDIERSVTMTGTVEPIQTVQVGSYVSGIVKQVSCDFNSAVTTGQICARIDPAPFQLVVEQNKADIATSEAQLRKDQSALAYARLIFERDSKLLADGIVSAENVDTDRNSLNQAEAQIGLDQATLVQKRAALHASEVNLSYTDIVSPVTGTVITRNVDVGQTVVSNLQSATLFLIAKDLTHMQVETNVAEADIAAVKVGQTASFSVQAYPERTFEGKVTQIRQAPVTVQSVVTYDVVVAVDNPDKALLPGMTADTHIVTASRPNVLRVPMAALRFTPSGVTPARRRDPAANPRSTEGGPPRAEGEARAWRNGGESGQARATAEGRPHRNGGDGEAGQRGRPGRIWVLRDGQPVMVPVRVGLDDGTLVEVMGRDLQEGEQVLVGQAGSEPRRPATQPQQRRPGGLGFHL